jgi:hypothetical protein
MMITYLSILILLVMILHPLRSPDLSTNVGTPIHTLIFAYLSDDNLSVNPHTVGDDIKTSKNP